MANVPLLSWLISWASATHPPLAALSLSPLKSQPCLPGHEGAAPHAWFLSTFSSGPSGLSTVPLLAPLPEVPSFNTIYAPVTPRHVSALQTIRTYPAASRTSQPECFKGLANSAPLLTSRPLALLSFSGLHSCTLFFHPLDVTHHQVLWLQIFFGSPSPLSPEYPSF